MILLHLYYTSHIPLYIDMQQIIRLDSINFMEQVVMLSNVSKILCFFGSKRCGDTETWYKDNKALMSFVK